MEFTREKVTEIARQLKAEGKLHSSNSIHKTCCRLDPNLPKPGTHGSLTITITCYEIFNDVRREEKVTKVNCER